MFSCSFVSALPAWHSSQGSSFLCSSMSSLRTMQTPRRRRSSAPSTDSAPGRVSSARGSVPKAKMDVEEEENATVRRLQVPNVRRLAKLFWRLALPYWKREKSARRDLAGVLALTLLQSGVSVGFSYISRDFWTALNTKDAAMFLRQAGLFFGALCAFTPLVVYYQYFRDRCALRWRDWLTRAVLTEYVTNRNYYDIDQDATSRVDNPDQRIAQDLSAFTYESLALMLTILVSCVDLASFSAILWSIYPPLFGVLLTYAATGTALTSAVGRRLVGMNYAQLVKEADLRYSLIRLRDNAESVAFFRGEARERAEITRRLQDVVDNLTRVIGLQRNLGFLQTGYRYLVQVLPALTVAPLYFKDQVPLGVVTQSFGAFSHILSDLSLVVNRFDQLSQFGAGIERLGEFVEALEKNLEEKDRTFDAITDGASEESEKFLAPLHNTVGDIALNGAVVPKDKVSTNGIAPKRSEKIDSNGVALALTDLNASVIELLDSKTDGLVIHNLTLSTPSGSVPRRLVENLSLAVEPGKRLLVAGPSGVGKSSLLRAISGLWRNGTGTIERPAMSRVFFVPQKPYCTLGTLRANLVYPGDESMYADDELMRVLSLVDLQELPSRMGGLDAKRDWSDTLSLGEQQRVQFARLLLSKPQLAVIDEGSAALSIEAEYRMYQLLESMNITVVSIGHRPSLLKYHDLLLRLSGDAGQWQMEEITQKQRDMIVAQPL